MNFSSYDDIFWKSELDDLFDLDQKERKSFDDFLEKKGYIKGSYLNNWSELISEYQNLRGMNYSLGDRIFGNILRDTRIENIVLKYSDSIILDPEYRDKLYTLVKNSDNNLNLQLFFLEKLKKHSRCPKITKNLEERIQISSNYQQSSAILIK